jgi:deaminated glutathione amidase
MRAAAIQLDSTADRGRNLRETERLVRAAAEDGATLIVLPERFDLRGDENDYARGAEPLDGPTVERMRSLARELGLDLVAGSLSERREGHEKLPTARSAPPTERSTSST